MKRNSSASSVWQGKSTDGVQNGPYRNARARTACIMGNSNQSRLYLYHAYLVYMKAHGYKNTLSLTMFGKGLPTMLKEYGLNDEKR